MRLSKAQKEIIKFYEATFSDEPLQEVLMTASDLPEFQQLLLVEAARRGFVFTRADLEATFDGLGETDTFAGVDFGSRWVSRVMQFGWVPKGYSR